ncbi:hypothetical protein GCK32_016427 [Trichostrongylus colubriformis]|uniref:Uncharacterized protein n=1 Tax=Trichostrongylus colubriformis TaxID=6319 RepID=A0AAN8IG87_TRICO
MMILIALIVLVGVVQSESMCTYSDLKHQTFAEINQPSPSIRLFLQRENGGISNTACTMSYRVKYDDALNPYYYFRIDQAGSTFHLMVTWDFTGNSFLNLASLASLAAVCPQWSSLILRSVKTKIWSLRLRILPQRTNIAYHSLDKPKDKLLCDAVKEAENR